MVGLNGLVVVFVVSSEQFRRVLRERAERQAEQKRDHRDGKDTPSEEVAK
jgi:heme exporter protein D